MEKEKESNLRNIGFKWTWNYIEQNKFRQRFDGFETLK